MYPLRVMPKRFAARVTRLIVSVGIEMANFTDGRTPRRVQLLFALPRRSRRGRADRPSVSDGVERPSASGNFFTRRPIEGNASEEHPPV
jgi:hypothetical protein